MYRAPCRDPRGSGAAGAARQPRRDRRAAAIRRLGALALAKSKIALASFSRAQEFEADGIGVGIASRAGFDPYGAARFLTAMGRNAELRAAPHAARSALAGLPLLASLHARARADRAASTRANSPRPAPASATATSYLAAIDGLVYGDDPSEGFVRGRRFLHPKLGFTFTAPDGFMLENTAQAVFGVQRQRRAGAAARRRARAGRADARPIISIRLDREHRRGFDRGVHDQRLPGGDRDGEGRSWAFRLYAVRFGSEVYRFIFAAKQRTEAVTAASAIRWPPSAA